MGLSSSKDSAEDDGYRLPSERVNRRLSSHLRWAWFLMLYIFAFMEEDNIQHTHFLFVQGTAIEQYLRPGQ